MLRFLLSSLIAATLVAPVVAAAEEVVVYSARKEHLIKPLFDRYTQQTGVEIRYITDKEGPLLQRLKAEGKRTPADMLITVDAGNLWHAAQEGVVFHLIGALSEFGKLGLVSVAGSPERAMKQYEDTVAVLDRAAADG